MHFFGGVCEDMFVRYEKKIKDQISNGILPKLMYLTI